VATRTGLSAHIPVNCGVPVARFAKQGMEILPPAGAARHGPVRGTSNPVQQRREHGALSGHWVNDTLAKANGLTVW